MSELQSLWQSEAPSIDTDRLIQRLQKQNQALRRVNLISFWVSLVCLIIVLALEFMGQLPTKGLLSLAGGLSFIWSVWKYRRDRARLIAAYSEEPDKLLPFLIKRTKAARNLGRYFLYTPLPSIAFGYGVGFLTDNGDPLNGADAARLMTILIPALIILGGLMIYGYRLARRKSSELAELEALWDELRT